MKTTFILLLTLSVLTTPAWAQNYAYFRAVDDAYIDSSAQSSNYGQSINLYLGDRTPAGGGSTMFFVQFDISDFAASNEIIQAELWLQKHEKYGAPDQQCTVTVHHILNPGWNEDTITWNSPPAYSTTPSGSVTGTFNPPGVVGYNVTADVIVDKPGGMTGWAVKMSPEVQWMWLNFYSGEQVPMPDYRPLLEVIYIGPVATERATIDEVKALYR